MKIIGFFFYVLTLGLIKTDHLQAFSFDYPEQFETESRYSQSTSLGNLLATSLQVTHNLDVVLFPSAALRPHQILSINSEQSLHDVENEIYSGIFHEKFDSFAVGKILGRDLKQFILNRTKQMLRHDFHTAGIEYSIDLKGGILENYTIKTQGGYLIRDDHLYRIALDQYHLDLFPGYWFYHRMNRNLREQKESISLKKSLRSFLQNNMNHTNFEKIRSRVNLLSKPCKGEKTTIATIQGEAHLSPLLGNCIRTQGIITTIGRVYQGSGKGNLEAYIQSLYPDDNPKTSEGIYLNLGKKWDIHLSKGDLIEVSGIVHEDAFREGLTRTGIRQIQSIRVLASKVALPESFILDTNTAIPHQDISKHVGNLNQQTTLDLDSGIGFWESLEGMLVKVPLAVVSGFAGGQEEYGRKYPKSYLNLFITIPGKAWQNQKTPKGGLIIDHPKKDYNPEIIQLVKNHLTSALDTRQIFEVGDKIKQPIQGVLAYNPDVFGGGSYALYNTAAIEGTQTKPKEMSFKPKTTLRGSGSTLTIATFNLENFSSLQKLRSRYLGKAIAYNMQCPDILNLVEIQDNFGARKPPKNKPKFPPDPDASKTLDSLIQEIKTCALPTQYKYVNIDPLFNKEGGQPGGNIRVAMLYNSKRVEFKPRGKPSPTTNTHMEIDGKLKYNPGRLWTKDPRFQKVRKPLVAEFIFQGNAIILIGNHLKSKSGDKSLWSAVQPPILHSSIQRQKTAQALNSTVQSFLNIRPNANIIMLGDFNDFPGSKTLKTLAGQELTSMFAIKNSQGIPLIPPNQTYTYNYRGNSQALDFILISQNLMQKNPRVDIPHFNSDFMWQVSDHDPVVAAFRF